MEINTINLKILLPYRIFMEISHVKRLVFETIAGSYGFYPQRLDCVAAIVPGILTYETDMGVKYIALDEGIMIKAGADVTLSVRNAIGGSDLGKLHESVESEFKKLDELEKSVHSISAKLESGFINKLAKFQKE